jgi:hypothetical protein
MRSTKASTTYKSPVPILSKKNLDLSAKRAALLAELKEVEAALTRAKQEEDQLPVVIKTLQ